MGLNVFRRDLVGASKLCAGTFRRSLLFAVGVSGRFERPWRCGICVRTFGVLMLDPFTSSESYTSTTVTLDTRAVNALLRDEMLSLSLP